jgi:hypothetical protein
MTQRLRMRKARLLQTMSRSRSGEKRSRSGEKRSRSGEKTKRLLRKALDLEIERERASLEKRFSNLSVDDPGFLHFLLFVLGF